MAKKCEVATAIGKRDAERERLYAKQRKERGFDDSETYSLSHTFARFIYPRLKRFRDAYARVSIPMEFHSSRDGAKTEAQWNAAEKRWKKALDEMLFAFEMS